jgi:transposase InsO family protein
VLKQPRATQRYVPRRRDDERALTERIINLAREYGRYGYRRITALLRMEGWIVNHKRVQRIWRREGLKVPAKQPKRARLWHNDGSCVRLRPECKDHVWAYDFVRHEALLNRVEMKGLHRGGCRSSPREAGGSLISET